MKKIIQNFLALPEFYDEEKNRKAKLIYYLILSVYAGFIVFLVERISQNDLTNIQIFSFLLILLIIPLYFILKRKLDVSAGLFIIILQVFTFVRAITFNGIQDTILFAIPGILVISGLILSKRNFIISFISSILILAMVGYLQLFGYINPLNRFNAYNFVIDKILKVSITAIGVYLFIKETINNISKIKNREDELRITTELLKKSEEKFKAIFINSGFPILLCDENSVILDCNKAAEKLFGAKDKTELISKSVIDLSPEKQPNGKNSKDFSAEIKQNANMYEGVTFEWTLMKFNGELMIVENTMTLYDFEGAKIYQCHLKDITEKRILENKLRERQLFIEKITEQTPDIIYIFNLEKRETIYANKNLIEILGYRIDEINEPINEFYAKILHPDDRVQFANYYSRQIEEDDSKIFNYVFRMKDVSGNWRWFTEKEKVFEKEGNKIITILGNLREITDIKKAEEELEKERIFNSVVLDNIPGIFFIYDKNGKLKRWNKNHEIFLGFGYEELKDKHFLSWFDDEDKSKILNIYNIDDKLEIESKIINKHGDKIPYYLTGINLTFGGEEFLVGYGVDITERYKKREELKKSEQKFSTLFNENPNSSIIINLETKEIIEINEAANNLLGFEKDEILGKSIFDILKLDKGSLEDIFEKIIKEENIKNSEINLLLPYGEKRGLLYGSIIEINNIKTILLIIIDITEFKRISEALKKSEELYKLMMEHMNEAVIQVDIDDKILYVNKSFEKLFGYKQEEIIGKTGYEFLIAPEYKNILLENNEKRKEGLSGQYEIKFLTKSGMVLDILVSAAPIKDLDNNTVGSIGVMTNITDQKRAIKLLKTSEEKFRLLAENAFDVIITQNMKGEITYISPSSLKILGYEPYELIGKKPHILFHEENYEILERIYNKKQFNKNYYTLTFKVKTKNGDTIWIEATSTIIRDIYDTPKEVQTIARDITQRRKMEMELEDVLNFVKHVINSLPIGLISVDEELNVTLFNEASKNFINKSQNYEGKSFNELFPILNLLKNKIISSLKDKETVEGTNTIVNESGELRYIRYVIIPIVRLYKPNCLILIEDITKAHNMEQLIIQSEKMLSIASLAAGMAHEINNPLGTIVQGCQNILRRVSPDLPKNIEVAKLLNIDISLIQLYFEKRQIFEIINSMREASSRASEIIKNMLQFSRKSESKKVNYNIENLIEQTIDLANNDYDFKKKYDFKSINIIKEIEQNLPEIQINVTEMQQVLFNLIRNAVQALRVENDTNKVPTIYIRAFKYDKFIKIEIEDNGPGIPEKLRNRVFEPFFTTKEIGEGTGLGLSVSYMKITNNHNGFIELESIDGHGTKFIIKLPI
jgi:PAS domain S-box-containing protein